MSWEGTVGGRADDETCQNRACREEGCEDTGPGTAQSGNSGVGPEGRRGPQAISVLMPVGFQQLLYADKTGRYTEQTPQTKRAFQTSQQMSVV